MKIIYIANHDVGLNDDEGAIAWALSRLGHDVRCLREHEGHKVAQLLPADLLLSHKWTGVESCKELPMAKVFWFFDLVESDDPSQYVQGRSRRRCTWMEMTLPHVDLGFCTDGDWVAKDQTGKLVWLPQGLDSRVEAEPWGTKDIDLLFVGSTHKCGEGRNQFVDDVRARYGRRFHHVAKGAYRSDLARLVARAKVVLAPDAPCSHRYWSNRVYWMLGLGGFLLHPYCSMLAQQYQQSRCCLFYRDRDHLRELIDHWSRDECTEERRAIAMDGLSQTLLYHTYLHRCHELVCTVQARLGKA